MLTKPGSAHSTQRHPSTTECSTPVVKVGSSGSRSVQCAFGGVSISSDGGLVLLKAAEERFQIVHRLASCFTDHRSARFVEHELEGLIRQRCFGLICGYEDLNDHDTLGRDPLFATAIGKTDLTGEERSHERDRGRPCAGKSTLSRLDCNTNGKIVFDAESAASGLLDIYFAQTEAAPDRIILDFDASCSRLYGHQEFRHFLAQYNEFCYLPLFVTCGDHLLAAQLHPADVDSGHSAVSTAVRLVTALRARWPGVRILIRADSGFCRDELLTWCERHDVDYVIGLPKNPALVRTIATQLAEAKAASETSCVAERVFAEFPYKTKETWSRERRVVAKAEHLCGTDEHAREKSNPRFVVTTLSCEEAGPRALYEEVYCARGEMENRIKEIQLGLFSERLSCSDFKANVQRLYYAAYGYALFTAIRRHALTGTPDASIQAWTFRDRLLKVGAVIRISVRRVLVTLSSAFPRRESFHRLLNALLMPLKLNDGTPHLARE